MSGILVCRESAIVTVDGERHQFKKGVTRIREGHPLLDTASVARYFEPIEVHYDHEPPEVETARQEPVIPAKRAPRPRKDKE